MSKRAGDSDTSSTSQSSSVTGEPSLPTPGSTPSQVSERGLSITNLRTEPHSNTKMDEKPKEQSTGTTETPEQEQPSAVADDQEPQEEVKKAKSSKKKACHKPSHDKKKKKAVKPSGGKKARKDAESSSSSSDSSSDSESESESDSSSSSSEDERSKRKSKKAKKDKKSHKKDNKRRKTAVSDDDESESESADDSSEEDEKVKKKTKKEKAAKKADKGKKKQKSKKHDDSDAVTSASEDSDSSQDEAPKSKKKTTKKSKQTRSSGDDGSDSDENESGGVSDIQSQIATLKLRLAGKKKAPHSSKRRRSSEKSTSKSKRKSSKKGGDSPDYKRVDQLWDSTIHNYKLKESAEEDESEFAEYAFLVRRCFNWENKYTETLLDIKSKQLRTVLIDVMKDCKSVSLEAEEPTVDPNTLFLYLEELRTHYKKTLKVKIKSEKKRKLVKKLEQQKSLCKALVSYIDEDYAETKKTLYPLLEAGNITFDLMWALFKPNEIAGKQIPPIYPDFMLRAYCMYIWNITRHFEESFR